MKHVFYASALYRGSNICSWKQERCLTVLWQTHLFITISIIATKRCVVSYVLFIRSTGFITKQQLLWNEIAIDIFNVLLWPPKTIFNTKSNVCIPKQDTLSRNTFWIPMSSFFNLNGSCFISLLMTFLLIREVQF